MHTIFEGILLGLTLAILVGPAFFAIIQISMQRGFWPAAIFAIGIFLSDLTIVILSYLGAIQILANEENYFYFGIIGGIILIVFGIFTFIKKAPKDEGNAPAVLNTAGIIANIFKGFFLNVANPFLWIFWIGVMVAVSTNYGLDSEEVMWFFSSVLATILATDLLKSFIGNKIKRYMTPKILLLINRIVGLMLMGFGVVLMVRVAMLYI